MDEPRAQTNRGLLALLALAALVAPGLICAVSATVFKVKGDTLVPVVLIGSVLSGLAAGILLTNVTTLKGGAKIGVGFVLCVISLVVCAFLSFYGCAVTTSMH